MVFDDIAMILMRPFEELLNSSRSVVKYNREVSDLKWIFAQIYAMKRFALLEVKSVTGTMKIVLYC